MSGSAIYPHKDPQSRYYYSRITEEQTDSQRLGSLLKAKSVARIKNTKYLKHLRQREIRWSSKSHLGNWQLPANERCLCAFQPCEFSHGDFEKPKFFLCGGCGDRRLMKTSHKGSDNSESQSFRSLLDKKNSITVA